MSDEAITRELQSESGEAGHSHVHEAQDASNDKLPAILVEAWFDVRCPWCYIGKGRLERGVEMFAAEHPEIPLTVKHLSFELAPDMEDSFNGTESDYMLKYEGVPLEQSQRMLPELQKLAAIEGLTLRFEDLKLVNTHKAHQLFQWARSQAKGEQLLDRLFEAYFTKCRNLADPQVLADLAVEVGLDRSGALAAVDPESGSEWDETVYREHIRGRMVGAQGVPYSLLNAKYRVSGGHTAEVWVNAFRELVRREFS